jgi:hypothetical protein
MYEYTGILLGAHPILHISRIRVNINHSNKNKVNNNKNNKNYNENSITIAEYTRRQIFLERRATCE